MRRPGIVLAIALLLNLVPGYHFSGKAFADDCTRVANLEEENRRKGLTNYEWFFTRGGIDWSTKVYQTILRNQSCVSERRFQEAIDVTTELQAVCKTVKKSSANYAEWKSDREYWKGVYGRAFSYACMKWAKVKLVK